LANGTIKLRFLTKRNDFEADSPVSGTPKIASRKGRTESGHALFRSYPVAIAASAITKGNANRQA